MKRILIAFASLAFGAAHAQQVDMAVLQKWSAAKVVRYHVDGAFHEWTPVSDQWKAAEGDVKDTLTVDFEWDINARALIGEPSFTNGASSVASMRSAFKECPVAELKGAYEHFTAASIALDDAGRLVMKGVRAYPVINAPLECPASLAMKPTTANSVDVTVYVPILDPKMLAIGMTGTPNASVSADHKSFVINSNGWMLTFTPALVK